MTDKSPQNANDPYIFILEHIDSVPQLEALVLFWNSRPAGWTCEDLAFRLYVPQEKANALLRDLVRLQLIVQSETSPPKYSYFARSPDQDNMMMLVDSAYRRDLVRVSTMIHSKASSAVREFARAFLFKKERD